MCGPVVGKLLQHQACGSGSSCTSLSTFSFSSALPCPSRAFILPSHRTQKVAIGSMMRSTALTLIAHRVAPGGPTGTDHDLAKPHLRSRSTTPWSFLPCLSGVVLDPTPDSEAVTLEDGPFPRLRLSTCQLLSTRAYIWPADIRLSFLGSNSGSPLRHGLAMTNARNQRAFAAMTDHGVGEDV
jgi:hypothetical protein